MQTYSLYEIYNLPLTQDIDSLRVTPDIRLSIRLLEDDKIHDNYMDRPDKYNNDCLKQAFSHAAKYLRDILEGIKKPYMSDEDLCLSVCDDVENILEITNGIYERAAASKKRTSDIPPGFVDKDLEKLIKTLTTFKLESVDKRIATIVKNWTFSLVRESHKRDALILIPDYIELFKQVGDEALICDGDYNRAFIYYVLVDCEWPIRTKTPEISNWHNLVTQIQSIKLLSNERRKHTQLLGTTSFIKMSSKCAQALEAYLRSWSRNDETIIDSAYQFIQYAAKELHNSSKNKSEIDKIHEIRNELLVAHFIREQVLYYVFLCGDVSIDKVKARQLVHEYGRTDRFALLRNVIELRDINTSLIFTYVNIQKIVDDVLDVLEVKKAGSYAYYTKTSNLDYVLPRTALKPEYIGKVSMMHVAYMNDPNEGVMLKRAIAGKTDWGKKEDRRSLRYPYVFIKCFSPQLDDLPMWEMYGDQSKGYSIVYDFDKNAGLANPLYNVCYLDKKRHAIPVDGVINEDGAKIINKYIDKLSMFYQKLKNNEIGLMLLEESISDILYLFKSADYKHEKEKRLIVRANGCDDKRILHTGENKSLLMTYYDQVIPIKEVILGPKFEDVYSNVPYLQQRLDEMAGKMGMAGIKVTESEIEFK